MLSLIVDVGLLNLTHVIFSFIIVYFYNREISIVEQYREKHNINLYNRVLVVGVFYSVFYLVSNILDIPWLKLLDNLSFAILTLEHSFQQSKGLLLKKIREKYSTESYTNLRIILDFLKWVLLALITLRVLTQQFPWLRWVAAYYPIFYMLVAVFFCYFFYKHIIKRNHVIKIFSLRFIILIFSIFLAKTRGMFHGTEYSTILARINTRYFSHLHDYKFILSIQVVAFLFMTTLGVWVYISAYQGSSVVSYVFPFLKSPTVAHFTLDHYMFSQRYVPARQITAIL